MITNIFLEQPEFSENDPRINRPASVGYNTNPGFMFIRHQILLPKWLVEGKSVLDLGSCNAASGAWCLSNGAAFYKGVEFQKSFVTSSSEALSKYYANEKWSVVQSSIEDFLSSNQEVFDVVLASGVLYAFSDQVGILNLMAKYARTLVIESMHPKTFAATQFLSEESKRAFLRSKEYALFMENEPFISIGRQGMVMPDEQTIFFSGSKPGMGAVKYIIQNAGFRYVDSMNQTLKQHMPKYYSPYNRFGLLFIRDMEGEADKYGFRYAASGEAKHKGIHKWREDK